MDLKLKDKVVLITGGTGGIGGAIVKGFLAEGAKVAFSSTSQTKIDALLPTLGAEPDQVAAFVADMNKEEDIRNFVEGAKAKFGTIDIVVPNAGYEGKAHPVQDMTLELFQQTYMLNVFSVMLLMKYAAPTLIEKKRAIKQGAMQELLGMRNEGCGMRNVPRRRLAGFLRHVQKQGDELHALRPRLNHLLQHGELDRRLHLALRTV